MPTIQIGPMILGVEQLRGRRYVVKPTRPDGTIPPGTCGFYPYAWTAIFVNASGPIDAARKAYPKARAQYDKATAAKA